MTINTNIQAGTVDYASTYNQPIVDALQRMSIDDSVLPCIHSGLQVTDGTGLHVNVSAGKAKGQYINFTQMNTVYGGGPATLSLPTDVIMPAVSAISVPASSTGWIVLNVNISPDPTDPTTTDPTGFYYNVQADNNTGSPPTITPVFVSSLSPTVGSSYPYTQIVLAYVVTGASSITSIDEDVAIGHRSFDITNSMMVQQSNDVTITGGEIDDTNCNTPTTPDQISNKDYVDKGIPVVLLRGRSDGTLTAQRNVTSVTNPATGVYQVNFTTALPNTNYVPLVTLGYDGTTATLNYRFIVLNDSLLTTSFQFEIQDATDAVVNNNLPLYVSVSLI